jgi:DNA processing protein
MSLYGRNTTSLFTDELVKGGYAIVSGLARGVDTRAHEATLREGGETVAILGSGIDRVYPSENYSLSERIVAGGGVVISEYPLGYPPLPSNFILRNRLISGLSDAVVVIEGKRKSGTLITATHAANQGRMVFAVPGQIDSPLSEASHFLIQNGAKLVTTPKDILEEVNETSLYDAGAIKQEMEQKLIQIVNEQPLHIDDIAKMSSLDTLDVSARLTNMEIKGLIKGLGKGYYQKIES